MYYFRLRVNEEEKTLALVSVYSQPDAALLIASSDTLWLCQDCCDTALHVIDVKSIQSVVAMVPWPADDALLNGRCYFLVEKLGLDIAYLGGNEEAIPDE